ncbi:MAG: helix-turn-helix transcriptional regulator [Cryomorphaceae bacterium]|mgnify:FL=1|jgi:transcriptional regulator with XRE-family HTH domain|nr:helix-turn-helix transcriptional regulator [Cryomorphaceae bacterium]MDG1889503.1 helix-turn-helix transcriptional regulator [Flavobacteriaceae bacterium]MBT3503602.1 helix-turn-helix transcriptional regulator [Cryomorphaceae bacterium]MBT3689440.1 helix-turn-helix transcriptional regulator [Cryomorphaceae bacterium]MBT4221938.1 helix-turn-helix transcriptional regulator [Cryomorphaceae bacterium]|tara:strand:- start:350 stop:715 length:366 start_codon:yes stop_codon:yes gene_type:complete
MNNKNILNRIKDIIDNSNLTNSEFAEKIGVPKSSISHLLSERNNPSLDIVYKISTAFDDITTDYLIFGKNKSINNQINEPGELFSMPNKEISEDSVKDPNNKLKSIVLIYENNKFEQIDKL